MLSKCNRIGCRKLEYAQYINMAGMFILPIERERRTYIIVIHTRRCIQFSHIKNLNTDFRKRKSKLFVTDFQPSILLNGYRMMRLW
jgi:hypothetical protein